MACFCWRCSNGKILKRSIDWMVNYKVRFALISNVAIEHQYFINQETFSNWFVILSHAFSFFTFILDKSFNRYVRCRKEKNNNNTKERNNTAEFLEFQRYVTHEILYQQKIPVEWREKKIWENYEIKTITAYWYTITKRKEKKWKRAYTTNAKINKTTN